MAQNILIGISGGIAAYKIPQLIRLLKKQGDNVRHRHHPAGRFRRGGA